MESKIKKLKKDKEIIFSGISISKGIVIGKPWFLFESEKKLKDITLSDFEVDIEIEKYRGALQKSRKDLKHLQKRFIKEGVFTVADILDAHLEILHDPFMTDIVEKRIRKTHKSTEIVFQQVLKEYKIAFNRAQNEVFKERIKDIKDISWRIFKHLRPFPKSKEKSLVDSIIIARDLIPSDTFEIKDRNILAFVTQKGGYTSHAAIIARAKGIPFVSKINVEKLKNIEIKNLIVDGEKGLIIVNPNERTLKKYQKLKSELLNYYLQIKRKSHLKAKTKDNVEIDLFANVESLDDLNNLIKDGFKGIGLFRSEYIFLFQKGFPSEKKQFNLYKDLIKKLKDFPTVIRLFDIGADKNFFLGKEKIFSNEINPDLGCRAIRFLLKNKKVLETQLRAILKASIFGNVSILIPFVSDISEVLYVKKMVKKITLDLQKENINISKKIPLGVMIEVPSSAIMSDVFLKEVDFCSIGTNDLIQYVMAADRLNSEVSHFFDFINPSIFRLLKMVINNAKKYNKSISICGEIASDWRFTEILIGMGIRKFSIAPRHMPEVKHSILNINSSSAKANAKKILNCKSTKEISSFISKIAGS